MISYETGGADLLGCIAPLWEGLRADHEARSSYFAPGFAGRLFEDRRTELLNKAAKLRVDLVRIDSDKEPFGYCISTVDKDGSGEVDSLYILPERRDGGYGAQLLERHLVWLKEQATGPICLTVAEGNKEVLPFYSCFGFFPHSLMMQWIASNAGAGDQGGSRMPYGTPELQFHTGSLELLPAIEPHWLALRDHHIRHSPHFSSEFEQRDFDAEKLALMYAHRNGGVAIDVVSTVSNNVMGYCIAAKKQDGSGVIESLYLRPEIRGIGAGKGLVTQSMKWLNANQAEPIRVQIAVGNEEAMAVYERVGFKLRTIILQHIQE